MFYCRGIEKIVNGASKKYGIVIQLADSRVAVEAEEATHPSCTVVVVDVEAAVAPSWFLRVADGTYSTLLPQLCVVVGNGEAVVLTFVVLLSLGLSKQCLIYWTWICILPLGGTPSRRTST
jgi:hypothetical protein